MNAGKAVRRVFEAVVELDKYGLLGGLSIKQAQRLVTGGYQYPFYSRVLNRLYKRITDFYTGRSWSR